MTETTIYPQGTVLRLSDIGSQIRSRAVVFEVEDYVSAEDAEDGVPFYWGSTAGGINNVTVPADSALELIRTAKQQADRALPTVEELCQHLGSALLSDSDTYRISETMPDGSRDVEVYGRTEDDLPFGFRVRVTGVWRTDD
jgi:hypothetical protein